MPVTPEALEHGRRRRKVCAKRLLRLARETRSLDALPMLLDAVFDYQRSVKSLDGLKRYAPTKKEK